MRVRLSDAREIIGVFNHHFRGAEDLDLRLRLIHHGQPESPDAFVPLNHLNAAYPERGALGGLPLDPSDGKIISVHPDPAANQELVLRLRTDFEHITAASIQGVRAD